MKKLLIPTIVLLFLFSCAPYVKIESAEQAGYTFDSDIDPAQFYDYDLIEEIEQMGQDVFLVSLVSDQMLPTIAITVVLMYESDPLIIAYAYFENEKIRHFVFSEGAHYKEIPNNTEGTELINEKLRYLQDLMLYHGETTDI